MIDAALLFGAGLLIGALARGAASKPSIPGHLPNGPRVRSKFTPRQFAEMPVEQRVEHLRTIVGQPAVRPTLGIYTPGEAEALLQGGLVGLNVYQLRRGVPGISWALHAGLVRYERQDPFEEWKSIREIWEDPHFLDGKPFEDCEGLAAAVAAERTVAGRPSQLVLHHVTPSLSHAVVQDLRTGALLDPSKTGGMQGRAR